MIKSLKRVLPMRVRASAFVLLAVAAVCDVVIAAEKSSAASVLSASPQGRTWAEIAKLPDLTTGIWEIPMGAGPFAPIDKPALSPTYVGLQKAFEASHVEDTPNANCVPTGMPGIMSPPFPLQILFVPGQVVIIFEAYTQVRHIYTDGQGHPEDPDLTYNGHSIGRWEGSTLVVDTVGVSTDTPLSSDSVYQNYGTRHSEKMRIVERMRLSDPETLIVETTIEDPEALTKAWHFPRTFKRHRDWALAEYICNQNNRNSVDEKGHAGIDLTPPAPQNHPPDQK